MDVTLCIFICKFKVDKIYKTSETLCYLNNSPFLQINHMAPQLLYIFIIKIFYLTGSQKTSGAASNFFGIPGPDQKTEIAPGPPP